MGNAGSDAFGEGQRAFFWKTTVKDTGLIVKVIAEKIQING